MRSSDVLQHMYDRMVQVGEGPYQANRKALKVLDILEDGEMGQEEVSAVLRGMDALSDEIVRIRDAAARSKSESVALLREA